MEAALPSGATEASKHRYLLALELAARCPSDLGLEIALAGSVSRGVADDDSDIEINLLVDTLLPPVRIETWLRSVGAQAVHVDEAPDIGGTVWTVCRYSGIWVEAGWTPLPEFTSLLDRILAGEIEDHRTLTLASMLQHALPLRSGERLTTWKNRLQHYPDGLAARIVARNTSVWSDPHVPGVRWALARRGERMALAMRLLWDAENMLRVLCAVNRVWEPDWKWTDDVSLHLTRKPERFRQRLQTVFTLADPARSVDTSMRLILQTLEIASEEFDVSAAMESIRASLASR